MVVTGKGGDDGCDSNDGDHNGCDIRESDDGYGSGDDGCNGYGDNVVMMMMVLVE